MLKRLLIENFKGWRSTGPMRLAPLTLFFGGNSAGKSSIPQLLLMLKQTVESPDRQRVLHLGDDTTPVDLGTYEDVVHGHDLTRRLRVDLAWGAARPVGVPRPTPGRPIPISDLGFDVTFDAKQAQPFVEQMMYRLSSASPLSMGMRRRGDGKYDLVTEGYTPLRQSGRPWPLPAPLHFHAFPDETIAYYQNTTFVSDLTLSLQELLRSILHVGPLREYPKRLYSWSGEVQTHVGERGERAIEAMLAAGERSYNFKPRGKLLSLQQLVAERLKRMELISNFEVKPIAKGRKEYEVNVRTRPGMPVVRLTDVGFGVSQVLPVIVECFSVPARSIVIFEQPEIHLHPRVQADLADVFIDAIHAREGGEPRGVQFLIESHSEHFLRRLQRRIAEDELHQDEAAMYFVEAAGPASRIEELELDLFGNIKNWPRNFFGDEMADLVARREAQARRSKAAGRK